MEIKELIGVTLGTCTLERVVGRGGMGAVFLAQQARPVRTVAVKVLIPSADDSPEQRKVFLERFRREADTVAKLEHKNILPIYEYDEAIVDGQQLAYLVMPYVRGGTLRQRIDEHRREGQQFDLKLVVDYISQVSDALDYAHSFGVIHRDVKPANLLFHQDGRLLLSDFGIVRVQASPALTSIGSFLGTVEYASPEQISTHNVDTRSDIYSLGIILYEMLIGTVPFSGPNAFSVMTRHLKEPVPSLQTQRPDLSVAIESVVMKALEKNPGNRYQSANAMASDLRAAVSFTVNSDAVDVFSEETVPASAWEPSGALSKSAGLPPTRPAGPSGAVPRGGGAVPRAGQGRSPYAYDAQKIVPDRQEQGQIRIGKPQAQTFDPRLNPDLNANPEVRLYHESRRVAYYCTALIILLVQFLVLYLMFGVIMANSGGTASFVPLGLLMGTGVNLYVLGTLSFIGVTMRKNIRRPFYLLLAVAALTPLVAGAFLGLGGPIKGQPILAYILLLLSNIFSLRELASVDRAGERVETVPVRWNPALVGAASGLFPLTIILFFAFATPSSYNSQLPPLYNLLGIFFIILLGSPTPGAVLVVSHSGRLSFPSLVRTSALAGVIMFAGAFLLVALWGIFFSGKHQIFYTFSNSWLAMGVWLVLLGLVGGLRGMLDAWLSRWWTKQN
ncbi:MAG TPA: protein kinase [Ktedonobacteraceae bacterium]|nr:protein kinase [Ktedonobacteraceae bacterium]